ncbi:MAG: hypothetical protein A2481_02240 [Candidatus Yonathbacteria bacterium RIFOXYC2_FULL_47_9]|nr:MAG: hypothetical protein A2481_02240 [Candidatus Yonathbacteria bacterium RIFOXYC2_FULL_47_9]HAT68624.1 hypothetical protein [Candidatus Yonathbacteria bacterium]
MQIKTKVTLFFGGLMIFLAILMVAYLQFFVRGSFRQEVMSNLHVAKEKNVGIYAAFVDGLKIHTLNWSSDDQLKKLSQTIVDPAGSSVSRQKAVNDFRSYLREKKMKYNPEVIIVDLLDQNGIVVASTELNRIGTDEHQEEVEHQAHYFSKAITAGLGEVFVRAAIFEEDEGPDPMFHVATRMFRTDLDENGGSVPVQAVLLVHVVSLEKVSGFLSEHHHEVTETDESEEYANIRNFETMETYLVNKDGFVVTPTRFITDMRAKKRIATEPVGECLMNNKEVAKEYLDYRGVPVIGVSACVASDGLVIINEMETTEAYAILDELILNTVKAGGGAFLVVVLVVFLAVRRMMRDLYAVTYAARWVTLGNYLDRVMVTSKDEIGHLASTFNMMLDKIESSQKEVKRSEEHLRSDATELEKTLKEREEEKTFLEQSKRAIQNLLEDAEETKVDLAKESTRLQTIISSIGDGLILIDGKYRIELVNPKAAELLATEGIDLMGADLRAVMKVLKNKKGELPLAEWPTEEMFMTKQIVVTDLDDELSITTEKRTEGLPVAFSIAPLEGDRGIGAVIIIRDVTEDRALDDAKSGFISVASHQLRTPLTTIRWYSEMLLSEDVGTVSGPQRDFLEEIHGGAERLYQTIDLLLGISRVESGKIKSEPVPVNLALFSEEIAHELAPQVQEKKLSLQILPPESQVVVMLDMLTLRQVILNLFSNAIRYTSENGVIEARWFVSEDGKEVTYSVHDNGIGIPEAQKSRIFSKFFRAENALEKVPDGSGLGLALVKELIEAWGGKVWFESVEGQGTTFLFTIPLEGRTREY